MLSEEEIQANLRKYDSQGDFHFQARHRGVERLKEFIAQGDFDRVKSLFIIEMPQSDLSWIGKCVNLKGIMAFTKSTHPVDFSRLKQLQRIEFAGKFASSAFGFERAKPISNVILRSAAEADLVRLIGDFERVLIYGPPAVFPVIENVSNLKNVELLISNRHSLDVSNLAKLENLEEITFYSVSKGLTGVHKLANLKRLRSLTFWKVKSIESKDWIFRIPSLKSVDVIGEEPFDDDDRDRLVHRGYYL